MSHSLKIKIGILMTSFCSLCYLAFAPIIANIAASMPDTDLSLIQMVITLPSLLFIVFSPLGGKLAVKFNKKSIVQVSVLMYFFGGIFPFFFHSNIWQILFGCAIIGGGSGMMMPMINAYICQYFDLKDRGQLMGLNSAFIAVGGLSFTFISGILAKSDWYYSFLVFLCLLPVLLVITFCLPKGEPILAEDGKAGSGFELNPYVTITFILGFVYYLVQNAFNTNSALYIEEMKLGGTEAASLCTMANTIGGITGGVLFGFIVIRIGDQMETISLAIAAIGFFMACFLPSFVPILIGGALIGMGYALFNSSTTLLLSKYLKPENNAFTVSIYSAVTNVGAAASPFFVNAFSRITNNTVNGKYMLCGVIIFVEMIAAFLINRKK